MEEIIIRYLHFLGIIGLSAALIAEHLLIAPSVTQKQMNKLALVDAIYGMSAVLVLATGLIMWFMIGKSTEVYTSNGLFHVKLTLFVVIALLSIYPTVFFLKSRKVGSDSIAVPKKLIMMLRVEILLLLLIPLFAVLMARGIGL
ncbi:DUF2214 family protein [Kangiella shandongensis]|uniref:DUF2214 family protein n=1 Tax=Kangiella shandongensis TaxID=2763258 RepID=UPI001CC13853|nr:DUF2214 family protein [Kangiella shandongensis]